ncbi:MAG: long-chain fatty acid--CoA ligase [Actinobacteria bacterium]|nr:long-chain fatty acid--CoA ligase [Actinomycetota bacterium]
MRDTDKTIAQIFWSRVEENGDDTLFIYHVENDFPPYTHKGKKRLMSWNEVGKKVKNTGMGLMALGAGKGDRISIMSSTRPEWIIADLGLLSIGGETGSIYPNNLPGQAQYIINDLDSRFVFVDDYEKRDGLVGLKNKSPQLEKIITVGCDPGDDPICMSFEELMKLGEDNKEKYSRAFDDAVAAGNLSDIASYIYTSGTTGIPKGAVHRHEAITYTVCTGAAWFPIEPGYTDLSFLPMAHVFEQFAGPFLDIYRGDVKIAFARDMDTVANDFLFIKPDFTRTAPRLFEKIYSKVWSKIDILADYADDEFAKALDIAKKVTVAGPLEGVEPDTDTLRKFREINEHHFSEIRELVLGGNMKFFVAGGAPLSKEINEFFWCIGIPVYELYGMTETGGATTNVPGHVKLGTVGRSWPSFDWPGEHTRTDVTDEGEIIMKGPNVMVEYLNKPEETSESIRDGWMHSGDVAVIDDDGFFKITDRIKDIIITAGGKNVAPVKIESMLKEEPLISQAVVYGDQKKFLTALITLDDDELEEQAKDLKIKTRRYRELVKHPLIREKVKEIVTEKNGKLAKYETIKNFMILDRDLTIEDGYLTPTMKVKRKKVYQVYGDQLDGLYPRE